MKGSGAAVPERSGMGTPSWGLLGPLHVVGERRPRTLGLASVVRRFNDLAVPGLGGIWFAKPLLLSLLGISIANRTSRPNIEVANAVEALACWLAFKGNGWVRDARLRGRLKLNGVEDAAYAKARRASFYVSQPMRQQTGQSLVALGLVDTTSERFNSFGLSQAGRTLLEAGVTGFRPHHQSVEAFLQQWVTGDDRSPDTGQLRQALSPLESLNEECRRMLRGHLVEGGSVDAKRRRAARAWVASLAPQTKLQWESRPDLIDEAHWRDLECGGRFFVMRDAAVAVLDKTEGALAPLPERKLSLGAPLPETVRGALAALKDQARAFLRMEYDPSPASLATTFARQCDDAEGELLKRLAQLDGKGLRWSDGFVVAGPAFRGGSSSPDLPDETDDEPAADEAAPGVGFDGLSWPSGISGRVRNLLALNLDLDGNLDAWLKSSTESG